MVEGPSQGDQGQMRGIEDTAFICGFDFDNIGPGSGELFKMMTGVNIVHVPYRGGAPAVADLLGGQVQVYFAGMPESIEYIRAGQLRALAVTTAARSDALTDIPTIADFVPGYDASVLYGVAAPKNTNAAIIERPAALPVIVWTVRSPSPVNVAILRRAHPTVTAARGRRR
jgi:Tripartite tricarboxylate transporter family receptor